MTKACDRGLPLDLKLHELSMHHFIVDNYWFEVSELVLKLAFLVFATKEVDTVLNRVRL